MPFILDQDVIAILDGCLPLLLNVLGPAVSKCMRFQEVQSGDATQINCNDVTFRQMTQNLVILPGCPKAKRTPLFQSSSRVTLRQRPLGNRRRHKTLARNMDRAILGHKNGRENLVNFFVVKVTISLPHRGGVRVSDGVSRLGLGLQTCLETRFFKSRSRSRMSQVLSRSRKISVPISSS